MVNELPNLCSLPGYARIGVPNDPKTYCFTCPTGFWTKLPTQCDSCTSLDPNIIGVAACDPATGQPTYWFALFLYHPPSFLVSCDSNSNSFSAAGFGFDPSTPKVCNRCKPGTWAPIGNTLCGPCIGNSLCAADTGIPSSWYVETNSITHFSSSDLRLLWYSPQPGYGLSSTGCTLCSSDASHSTQWSNPKGGQCQPCLANSYCGPSSIDSTWW